MITKAYPVVSIVLPTYNGSRYLAEAIDSCRNQTFTDWELIIVDDASTDATPHIISRLVSTDERIKSIRHKTNRKLPAALNSGFFVAQGRYFTWTSDDNLYKSSALTTMVEYLSQKPDVDVVYTDFQLIDSCGKPLKEVSVLKPSHLVSCNTIGPCFLYRREVHERLGGYAEDLFLAEDYDFWLRASNQFRLSTLHESLYLYRVHTDSLSERCSEGVDCSHRLAMERSLPQMSWLTSRERAIGWLNLAAFTWRDNDLEKARLCVLNAMKNSPLVTILVLLRLLFFKRRISRTNTLRLPEWL